jgi:hypothetical protein
VRPYTFRASADERRRFDAEAEALGLRPNDLARRRAFRYPERGDSRGKMSTETTETVGSDGQMSTDSPPIRELTLERDE